MAGPYQIVPTDGGAACGIELIAEPVGQAWRARPDPSCAARVRASAAVVAWRPLDGIVLLDAQGKPAMTFVEDEPGCRAAPTSSHRSIIWCRGSPVTRGFRCRPSWLANGRCAVRDAHRASSRSPRPRQSRARPSVGSASDPVVPALPATPPDQLGDGRHEDHALGAER
ncbi:AprI/Inh family metalloprotease inhibitor [Sphingomonas naasensis]